MELLLWMLAGHFIGDFPFQGEFLAMNKGKSNEIMFYHVSVYALTIFVFSEMYSHVNNAEQVLSIWSLMFIFGTHFVVDTAKAKWKMIDEIWVDQACHILFLVMVLL